MSDKFLGTGGEGSNISNGTAEIYAASLRLENLDPSKAVKTNSTKLLISTNLEISDINNLQQELDNNISNPFVGTLQADDFKGDSIKDKTEASSIDLTSNSIDLVASDVLVNGVNIEDKFLIIDTNTTNISNNSGNISNLTTQQNINTSDISSNNNQIGINTTDISNLNTTVSNNSGNISNNTTSIGNNVSNISNNTTSIGNNTNSIGNNTTSIGNNTSNISNLTTQQNTNTSDISSNNNQIGINTNDVSNLNTTVSSNSSDIATNVSEIAANGVLITSLQNDKYDKTGGPISGQVDLTGNKIINLGTPTLATDAATKDYVDSNAGNPFNQSLNTGDAPTFNGLTMNGTIDFNSGSLTGASIVSGNLGNFNSATSINAPTGQFSLANKVYVDNKISNDIATAINALTFPIYSTFIPTVNTVLFDDGIIRVSWIALELQPSFELLVAPSGIGPFPNWVNSNITFNGGDNLIGQNSDNLNTLNTKNYFGQGAIIDPQYNHVQYGCSSRCELMSESDNNYPFYKINVSTGDPAFSGFCVVEKFV